MMRASLAVIAIAFTMIHCAKSAPKNDAPASSASSSASAAPSNSIASSAITTPGSADSLVDEYRGTIGTIAIVMRLQHVGGLLKGAYFYEKNGVDLDLNGSIEGAHLTLDESANKNKTGAIKADVATDGSITGTWSNPAGDKSLPLHVTPLARIPNAQSAIVFTKKIQSEKHVGGKASGGACITKLQYAEVFGLAQDVEAKINPKLLPAKDELPDPVCDHGVLQTRAYSVSYDTHGILSVRMMGEVSDSQAAHPSEWATTLNVFLSDGSNVKLFGDILRPHTEADLQHVLSDLIDRLVRDDTKHDLWTEENKATTMNYLQSPDFVLESTGIRFYADELPHVTWALNVGFEVPFSKLASATNTTGRAAAIFRR
jgi:hypothetical protein